MIIKFPKEVWIAGKGPSLDNYDWAKAGDFRIGINEAGFVIPDVTAIAAMDRIVLEKINHFALIMYPYDLFPDFKFPYSINLEKSRNFRSTAANLLLMLHKYGVQQFYLIGFDCVTEDINTQLYAKCLNLDKVPDSKDFNNYNVRIRAEILRIIDIHRLNVSFFHEEDFVYEKDFISYLKMLPKKVRIDANGAYWIPKSNKITEDYMDRHFLRHPNELKWSQKSFVPSDFKGKHVNVPCYFIKGNFSNIKIRRRCPIIVCDEESLKSIEDLSNPIYNLLQFSCNSIEFGITLAKIMGCHDFRFINFTKSEIEKYIKNEIITFLN